MQSQWSTLLVWQQDYFWFLAGLLWIVLGLIGRLKPGELPSWVSFAAFGGALRALLEICWHLSKVSDFSQPRPVWDFGLAAVELVSIAGLLFAASTCVRSGRRRALILASLMVLLCVLMVWRVADPVVGGWLIVLYSIAGATGAWIAHPPVRLTTRIGLVMLGLQPLLGVSGPVGALIGQIRAWMALSSLGGYAALSQMLGAGFLCIGFCGESSVARLYSGRREARQTLVALLLWLGLGLGLASWSGRDARVAYEDSLVARARSGLAAINRDAVRNFVGSGLRFGPELRRAQPSGDVSVLRQADFSAQRKQFEELRSELGVVDAANPGVQWSHLMILRDGELISYAFSPRVPDVDDAVAITRTATPRDIDDWKHSRSVVEAPLLIAWGQLARVRVPIVDARAGMLGWLALDFGVQDWIAVQSRARIQAFMIVGLGAILAGGWFLHRLRVADREAAVAAAQAAETENHSKTLFLAKVSHELRTPLQSILGYGYLLRNAELSELHRRYLEAINSHGELLARLVNDLIDLAALQSGSFPLVSKRANLAALAKETVDALRPAADAKRLVLSLRIEAPFEEWRELDAARVRQLLTNLVGNAVKYTVEGAVDVRIRGVQGSDRCVVCVADTGPGIPVEEIPLLFQPFRRLEATSGREGSGLGLALASAICRSMGGSLAAESNGYSGSVFTATLSLPLSTATASTSAGVSSRRLQGRQIVVADDNQLVRELFMDYLRGEGATCVEATDGQAAIDLCGQGKVDTLVIDLSMPRIDGYEATARLRALNLKLRIVGVSAHVNGPERNRALASGMDEFLAKPVNFDDLVTAIAGRTGPAPLRAPQIPSALRSKWADHFRQELPEQLAELEDATSNGDQQRVRRIAHHLKNSADVVGLPTISELLQDIIDISEGSEVPPLKEGVELLISTLDEGRYINFRPGPNEDSGHNQTTEQ